MTDHSTARALELAANIMASMRRAKFPSEYAAEAHDEFEATVLVPMLIEALTPSVTADTVSEEVEEAIAETRAAIAAIQSRVSPQAGMREAALSAPKPTIASLKAARGGSHRGDFVTGEDGHVVFWPDGRNGAFTGHNLRKIADELDRRNSAWDAQAQPDPRISTPQERGDEDAPVSQGEKDNG